MLTHRSRSVVEAARLHRARERRARGETLIEGPHLLQEALSAGAHVSRVFFAEDDAGAGAALEAGLEVLVVDARALQRLAGTDSPRGPVAVAAIPPEAPPSREGMLVSWAVSDPGNVGTMIRTASAFGWGFGYAAGSADPWSPKVLRAGVGRQFSMPVSEVPDVGFLRSLGLSPWATVVAGGTSLHDVTGGPFAILVGEEAAGLPETIVSACEGAITIDMPGGVESLNASVAAGIVVHWLSKHGGKPGERV